MIVGTRAVIAGQRVLVYQFKCRCGRWGHSLSPHETDCRKCTAAHEAQRRRYQRRKAATKGKRYKLTEIAERDGWRCHICGKLVDRTLSGRHPLGPSADHLLPVAAGGGDDPENIALAHLRCNVKRGVGQAQLRLGV